MTFCHESGHIVGGWIGGGELIDFELKPWHLPHSLFHPDPKPLVTLWSGPLLGVLVPWLWAAVIRRPWAVFIADFCMVANGTYIAVGWMAGDPLLDTTRLLDQGAHPLAVAAYAVVTFSAGYVRFRRDCIHVFQGAPSKAGDAESVS